MVEEIVEDKTLILLNNNNPTRHNILNETFSAITNIKSSTLLIW